MSFSSSRRPALRSVFSSILLGPLGVAAAALGGCWVGPDAGGDRPASDAPVPVVPGAGGAGGGGSLAGFRELSCDDFGPDALGALDVDALEVWNYRVRYERPYPDGSGEGPGTRVYEKSLSLGAPCAGARDAKGCEGALEAARNAPWAEGGWPGRVTTQRLLVTKGDEVTLIESYEALLTRLLPIDRFDKLPLVLRYAEGGGLSCQAARLTLEGFEVWGDVSFGDCPIMKERRLLRVGVGGDVSVLARDEPVETGACAGRRPAGLAEPAAWSGGALGRHLARQAYLEAASVEAFERLALELASFGAPAELIDLARRAGADEVRHHALIVALGRRFAPDFACPAPEAAPARPRSRFEFALENAVEGCVRETWGALVAHHQAARAADEAVRFASALIADDETRHAELAWSTQAWLCETLSEGERRALVEATERAAEALLVEATSGDGLGEGERRRLGLPSPDEARALLERLRGALWARPLAA